MYETHVNARRTRGRWEMGNFFSSKPIILSVLVLVNIALALVMLVENIITEWVNWRRIELVEFFMMNFIDHEKWIWKYVLIKVNFVKLEI